MNSSFSPPHPWHTAFKEPPEARGQVDEGSQPLASIVFLPRLGMWATADTKSAVKVFHHDHLLREFQFNEPIHSITFNDQRADLLLGFAGHVALLRAQDYLPLATLRYLESGGPIPEDGEEAHMEFDETLDFWEAYRPSVMEKEGEHFVWHTRWVGVRAGAGGCFCTPFGDLRVRHPQPPLQIQRAGVAAHALGNVHLRLGLIRHGGRADGAAAAEAVGLQAGTAGMWPW